MSWTWTRNCINAFQLFDAVSLTDRSDLKPSVTFMRRTKVVREPLCQFKYINAISYTLITSQMKENCPLSCPISFTPKQTGFDKKINTWLNTVQSKCMIVSFEALAYQPWVSKSFLTLKDWKSTVQVLFILLHFCKRCFFSVTGSQWSLTRPWEQVRLIEQW